MLKNYFKIAIAVLRRRKFFTFISLFGISFTLTILIVVTSFMDHVISASYPDVNRGRELYVNTMSMQSSKQGYTSNGPVSFYFLDHYVSKLKTPAKLAFSSFFVPTNAYVNNKKIGINISCTNDQFWEVLQFDFLEGKPYTKQQIRNGEYVAVISADTKRNYFGDVPTVVGKYIEADNIQYRVIGVVKSVPITNMFCYADMYLPYTLSKVDLHSTELRGTFGAILLANSSNDLDKIRTEYAAMVPKLPVTDKLFDRIYTFPDTYLAVFTRMSFGQGRESGLTIFYTAVGILILLFMLLPTLNLININISRIMERSSEIGVRKAFGASSRTLVFQFIVENIILTFIGGIIGVGLSYLIIYFFNSSQLIANAHLSVNLTVLTYSVIACFVFGFLSGVYPAWRMSRLHVVTALKAQ